MDQPIVYVVSDSVGETAELVVKASLSQFNNGNFKIQRIPYVDDEGTILEAIELAKSNQAMLGYTLVKPELRAFLKENAEKNKIIAVDIMGPMIDAMSQHLNKDPRLEPGLVHKLDEDYFKRIEAVEFAVKYDDGRDPRGILLADIILIGVSRTSKTPLSQFLAHKKLKVANVPIVPEVEPPEELYKIHPAKCIALKITPEKLNHIRQERLKALGLNESANYANINRIKEELDYFNKIVDKLGCQVIDVSNKAVEETANVVQNMIRVK
ncbi:pyruvate, water dikinase regulatory protein [Salinibacillus xinjiangensis]|uniref:Putative pyruvate, phosphate dikinase regulatory protein n=1 Tax=Salinibacillus xinjiangensis TaxID=1229268 RepID=A0A6G1X6Q8_9BACI|nr:pyruvate, water dikinase regulatory protein [Salinibacillus xinjiangensis]MRG86622.1 pyruvate, phosphate dikinase/phosphoenolpyruvate synthase regulator [Salinibacillus xinjiangensis]